MTTQEAEDLRDSNKISTDITTVSIRKALVFGDNDNSIDDKEDN